jgi:hypothetical protein
MANKSFGFEAALRKAEQERSLVADDSQKALEGLLHIWEVLAEKSCPNLGLPPGELVEFIRREAPLDCAADFEEAFLAALGGLSGDSMAHKRALKPSMRLQGRYEKQVEVEQRRKAIATNAAHASHNRDYAADSVLRNWYLDWRARNPGKSMSCAARHAHEFLVAAGESESDIATWKQSTIYAKIRKIEKTLQSAKQR